MSGAGINILTCSCPRLTCLPPACFYHTIQSTSPWRWHSASGRYMPTWPTSHRHHKCRRHPGHVTLTSFTCSLNCSPNAFACMGREMQGRWDRERGEEAKQRQWYVRTCEPLFVTHCAVLCKCMCARWHANMNQPNLHGLSWALCACVCALGGLVSHLSTCRMFQRAHVCCSLSMANSSTQQD